MLVGLALAVLCAFAGYAVMGIFLGVVAAFAARAGRRARRPGGRR
jgi:hypothetical protein